MSKFTLKDLVKEEIESIAPKTTLWEPLTVEVKEPPVKEFNSKTSRISSLSSLNEDLKENKTVVKSGWVPLVQKTEQVSVIENVAARPRTGMKSLLEVNTDIQPIAAKKEPLDELVQSFTTTIQKQEEVNRALEPVIEPVAEPEAIVEAVEVETVKQETLIDKASAYISSQVKNEDSFQQPVSVTPANFAEVSRKIKYLEEWLSKVSLAGPGGGEVRFLRLDDVNYSSWQDRDRHKILKYEPNINPAYDGVTFGFLTGDQGPIYSMKYDTTGYTSNANVAAGLTAWNPDKDCLNIHQADGTILQVGLESYIQVANETGNTLSNGDFVVFTGINGTPTNPVPKVAGFLADANAIPLYSVGVLTNDIQSGGDGRATVLGEVRDINTTGSAVGETWYAGNLLWAHPSLPGKLTVTQPTAPNVAVSVAAVLKADATNGVLLVRPTVFPRLYYAEYSSSQNQTAPNTNFGHYVTFNSAAIASGFTKNSGNTEVIALHTGLYNMRAKLQFTSSNASQQTIYIWGRKNGVDLPESTIRVTSANNGSSNAPIWSRNVSMQAGDRISIMWAVSSTDVTLSASSTAFTPNTSSAVFAIHQVAL